MYESCFLINVSRLYLSFHARRAFNNLNRTPLNAQSLTAHKLRGRPKMIIIRLPAQCWGYALLGLYVY